MIQSSPQTKPLPEQSRQPDAEAGSQLPNAETKAQADKAQPPGNSNTAKS